MVVWRTLAETSKRTFHTLNIGVPGAYIAEFEGGFGGAGSGECVVQNSLFSIIQRTLFRNKTRLYCMYTLQYRGNITRSCSVKFASCVHQIIVKTVSFT